jgi:hypothetical protein
VALRRLARFFLAAALLVATHASQLHPFAHFQEQHAKSAASASSVGDKHPFEGVHTQLCDVCVAGAALGAAASVDLPALPAASGLERAFPRRAEVFIAAFSPLFRSQAPPTLV